MHMCDLLEVIKFYGDFDILPVAICRKIFGSSTDQISKYTVLFKSDVFVKVLLRGYRKLAANCEFSILLFIKDRKSVSLLYCT